MSRVRKVFLILLVLGVAVAMANAQDEGAPKPKAHKDRAGAAPAKGMDAEARFKAMDTDGNGTVSLAEFQVAHEKRMEARKAEMGDKWDPERAAKMPSAEQIFTRQDTNKDGQLTLEEMNQRRERPRRPRAEAEASPEQAPEATVAPPADSPGL